MTTHGSQTLRLLGPVEAWDADEVLGIGHARQRCVLAVLAVEAGSPVSVETLLNRVWGVDLPARGANAVYGYISRLRSVLTTPIVRHANGYVLKMRRGDIDLHRFRQTVAQSRRANDPDTRLALLDEALSLWHGTAFAGLDSQWVDAQRVSLDAERQAAEAERTDTALQMGLHDEILSDLVALAARHPLDERVVGQLMLTMYRCGRQADALNEYQRIRRQLADDLGIAPGQNLKDLHQQVLEGGPTLLAVPAPGGTVPGSALPVPRQLPPAPSAFVGRTDELALLSTAVRAGAVAGQPLLVATLTGTGGIGKTWLALHWAHANLHLFPDGQLFVDLQGSAPSQEPMPPTVALRGLLHALGVEPSRAPTDLHAKTALFRSLVAERRMLIVLDNAFSADQLSPLLPGGADCTVIITSRRHLAALVTRHSARQFRLDVISPSDARRLLRARLGEERCQEQPDALEEILARCAGLPLALSIVAGRAEFSPEVALPDLAAGLRTSAALLESVDDDDPSSVCQPFCHGLFVPCRLSRHGSSSSWGRLPDQTPTAKPQRVSPS